VASDQKVLLLHALTTPLRFHGRRHIAPMPVLTSEPTFNLNVRKLNYPRLVGYVSTNSCAGYVGCSFHIFELDCGINSKWAVF